MTRAKHKTAENRTIKAVVYTCRCPEVEGERTEGGTKGEKRERGRE